MYASTTIVGNLGADAEMRYTPSGTAVSNFRVAVNERWNDRDGQPQEKTTWFRVAVWGKQAEAINQYLVKGRLVLVEGTVEARAYTAKDGTPRAALELRARDVRFLGGKGDVDSGNGSGSASGHVAAELERQERTQTPPGMRRVNLNDDEPLPF